MEKYREKLKIQNISYLFICVALLFINIMNSKGSISPAYAGEKWSDMFSGFVCGASCALSILMIIGMAKNLRAILNDEELRKLYVKENDEMTAQIYAQGCAAGSRLAVLLMLAAAVIAGYFNVTVSVSCLACTMLLALCMAGGKLYYKKKLS